jgi:hypothetical protein
VPACSCQHELKVIEHATTDAVTDTGASGDSAGDILTFANEADDKEKVGSDQGICFRTVGRQGVGALLDALPRQGSIDGLRTILRCG